MKCMHASWISEGEREEGKERRRGRGGGRMEWGRREWGCTTRGMMMDMHGPEEMTICGSRDGRNGHLWRVSHIAYAHGKEIDRRMKGQRGGEGLCCHCILMMGIMFLVPFILDQ